MGVQGLDRLATHGNNEDAAAHLTVHWSLYLRERIYPRDYVVVHRPQPLLVLVCVECCVHEAFRAVRILFDEVN